MIYLISPAHSLTRSWSCHGAHEKLPIVQPLKNFSAFYGTRRFITAFTRALHWSLSWVRSIQSILSHPIPLRSILILFTSPANCNKIKWVPQESRLMYWAPVRHCLPEWHDRRAGSDQSIRNDVDMGRSRKGNLRTVKSSGTMTGRTEQEKPENQNRV
jgi:hypothetical protein